MNDELEAHPTVALGGAALDDDHLRVPTPTSPSSTSGDSMSATEESDAASEQEQEQEQEQEHQQMMHHQLGDAAATGLGFGSAAVAARSRSPPLPPPASGQQAVFDGASTLRNHAAIPAGPSSIASTSRAAYGAGSGGGGSGSASASGNVSPVPLSSRRKHHHHQLALGTGAAKMGSSITDSAQSTEDERDDDDEGDVLDEINDEGRRPAVLYPALATPTAANKGSFWPFGTIGGHDGMVDDPIHGHGLVQSPKQHPSALLSPRPANDNVSSSTQACAIGASSSRTSNGTHALSPVMTFDDYTTTFNQPRSTNAAMLPHEILLKILKNVRSTPDLVSSLRVCKSWCQCGVELLWNKPLFPNVAPLISMLIVLGKPGSSTFPYASFIKRLNFSQLADRMTDSLLVKLHVCHRLERLTLAGCTEIGDPSLANLLVGCKSLVALDLSECAKITDDTLRVTAKSCPRLQGLNLSGCKLVTDEGMQEVAKGCPMLRRVKLRNLDTLTDASVIALALNCPLLLEVDLYTCSAITDRSLWALFRSSSHLRELSLNACTQVSGDAFPQRDNALLFIKGATDASLAGKKPLNHRFANVTVHGSARKTLEYQNALAAEREPSALVPGVEASAGSALPSVTALSSRMFDHMRYLDLTGLASMTDAAMDGIVSTMPHIRNLVLAKCVNLTDDAVISICKLGKHIHFLHLGHVSSITDKSVTALAKACTRLRYIDLACCPNLTDLSVLQLAENLPRLKRIGLVRVANLTDQAINGLAQRTTLERIHLSYCENVQVSAIHYLLYKLQRLNHLSLTGVPAFRRGDLQHFCRPPPKDFNAHQRSTFCVYSGKGVVELRKHLNQLQQREYFEALSANGGAPLAQGQGVGPGPGGLGLVLLQADLMHFPPPAHAHGTQPGAAHGLAHAHAHGFQSATAGPAFANPLPADEDLDELADEEDETGGDDDDGDGDGDDDDRPARNMPAASLPAVTATATSSGSRSSGRHSQLLNRVQSGGVRSHTSRNGGSSGPSAGGSGSRTSSNRQAHVQGASDSDAQHASSMRLATIPPFVPSARTASPANSASASGQQALPPAMWSSWVAASPTAAQHTSPYYGLSTAASAVHTGPSASRAAGIPAMPFRPSPRHTAPPNMMQDVSGSPSLTAAASLSSHYLNTEAFQALVHPSIARAAAEQDAYEAGQSASGNAGGTDEQGDSRMRSASVDIELQNDYQEGEEMMETEESEQARNGRGRRNTIRQSTYQDVQ